MNYRQTLQAVDTLKALTILGIEGTGNGSYVSFPCPKCHEKAVFKAYGEKKNVWYCPKCKAAGNIVSLAMEAQGVQWEEAKQLLGKAITLTQKEIAKELALNYELQYHKFFEEQGIPEELCKTLGIGVPKGKAMLAGCVTFTVFNDAGVRVAYYGIRINDRRAIFHHSFNPEHYLYNFNRVDTTKDVVLVTDMMQCLRFLVQGIQAVSNFGLPYLSQNHLELLKRCQYLSTPYQKDSELASHLVGSLESYLRFFRT